jgi:hypothetical protein
MVTDLLFKGLGGTHPMRRFFGALVLAGVLLAPGAAFGEERHRYYDRTRHDWHEWNENEARAYRHWLLEEQRERQYREYARLKAARQRAYWRWRHEHSDWR